VDGYSGDAGNALMVHSNDRYIVNGMMFTTVDSDNDPDSGNCAEAGRWASGWWYNRCGRSMINNGVGMWVTYDVQASRMLVKLN